MGVLKPKVARTKAEAGGGDAATNTTEQKPKEKQPQGGKDYSVRTAAAQSDRDPRLADAQGTGPNQDTRGDWQDVAPAVKMYPHSAPHVFPKQQGDTEELVQKGAGRGKFKKAFTFGFFS